MLLLRKPSAASPADETRLKKDRLRVGMISVDSLHQKVHAAFHHVAGVVVHTAKGRRQMPCALNVVKADKREISGNLPAEVFHQQARVPGLHITENKQAVDALCFPFRQRRYQTHARLALIAGVQAMRARICSVFSCDMFARVV